MARDGRGGPNAWNSGWSGAIISAAVTFKDNIKLFFGTGKDCWIYSDGISLYLDTTAGSIYLQDVIYSSTHVKMGDSDVLFQGTSDDYLQQFNGTNETITFAAMPVDTVGAGYTITMPNGGTVSAGTTGRLGGFYTVTAGNGSAAKTSSAAAGGAGGYINLTAGNGAAGDGAGAGGVGGAITLTGGTAAANSNGGDIVLIGGTKGGSGSDGDVLLRGEFSYVYNKAGTADTYIGLDAAHTTALTATLATGTALTAGLKIAPLAGDINLDSVAKLILDGGLHVNRTAVTGATASTGRTTAVLGVSYAGTVTITLSTLDCTANRIITVKDEGGYATTYPITIATEGAELIDGSATALIDTAYTSLTLYSNGTNWFVM